MRQVIQPRQLSDPRPRYSQGILTQPGKVLFIAGQTATDRNGQIVGKGDIEAQARQVFENIKAVLEEVGGGFDSIAKMTTYITDIKFREGIHRVRGDYFKDAPPASTLIVVKGLAREEFMLEIEAIAVL